MARAAAAKPMESGPKAAPPHEQSPCASLGRLVKTSLDHGAEHPTSVIAQHELPGARSRRPCGTNISGHAWAVGKEALLWAARRSGIPVRQIQGATMTTALLRRCHSKRLPLTRGEHAPI